MPETGRRGLRATSSHQQSDVMLTDARGKSADTDHAGGASPQVTPTSELCLENRFARSQPCYVGSNPTPSAFESHCYTGALRFRASSGARVLPVGRVMLVDKDRDATRTWRRVPMLIR
jgi:hypothetical protein